MTLKRCSHCKQSLPLSEFNRNAAQRDGFGNQCRTCNKESQARSRAKFDGFNRGFWHASHRYGLTREEYIALRARACCDICGATDSGSNRGFFDIDHCHATGKIRGVLCRRCNIALHEDVTPAILRAMADYLEKHQASSN